MHFGLTTDFRNLPGAGKSSATVYAETIDLFAWAETLGFGAAYVFEHHFTDDDYMSSPMIAATAIAARTKQMRIGPDIAILPLYDPVRVAEDGAVLDLISNGRLDFGVGLGYRPEEYAGYGLDIALGCDIVVASDAAKLAASLDQAIRFPADVVFYALDELGQTALHRAGELIFVFPSDVGSPTLSDAVKTMLSRPEGVVGYRYAGSEKTALFQRSQLTGWVFVLGKSHPADIKP